MQDLINLGKKVAIAGGKEAMKYFRKPNLDFDNKSQTHLILYQKLIKIQKIL